MFTRIKNRKWRSYRPISPAAGVWAFFVLLVVVSIFN